MLPVGAAEGTLGTALLNVCVRKCHFTSHVGRDPRPKSMPAAYISFGNRGNPFDEEGVDSALRTGFLFKQSREKSLNFQIISGKSFRVKSLIHFFSEFSVLYFLSIVVGKKQEGFPRIAKASSLAGIEGGIHSRFTLLQARLKLCSVSQCLTIEGLGKIVSNVCLAKIASCLLFFIRPLETTQI